MKCFNCYSKSIFYLFPSIDFISKKKFKIYRCKKCHIDFPVPRPSKIDKFYPKNYRDYNQLIKFIFNVFYKKKALSFIKLFKNNKKKTILEIGCGNGFLLKIFKLNGWKVFGTERKNSINYQNEIDLNIKDKKINDFENNFFDLILLNNSLEHLVDFRIVKNYLKKKLKKNGLLIINIPSVNSFQYQFGKGDWFHLDVPRHLQLFDDNFFFDYAKRNNLKILNYKSTGLIWELYGWFQTLNNKLFNNKNLFFKSLSDFYNNKISFLIGLLQLLLLGPISLILTIISFSVNKGAIKQFIIKKI